MHYLGFFALLTSLIIMILLAGAAFAGLWRTRSTGEDIKIVSWLERGQAAVTGLVTLSSLVLLWAFVTRDFTYSYVYRNSDEFLPMHYQVSAFWAGQEGSLLFWLWVVVIMAGIWLLSPVYKSLARDTKAWFWGMMFIVQGFLLLLLTGPSNPFIVYDIQPMGGSGLNPLLQNVGMIFHPPMTFLGYAGFTIPACLALAGWLSGDQRSWIFQCRNWVLFAWVMLTGGAILLGGWWAYMELGWGGYWAWDPVENASLIPWLISTAFLHTAIVGKQRNVLHRSNLILINLSLLTCFFATYLVRSDVIESLHTFGGRGVGGPLVIFMLAGLALTLFVAMAGQKQKSAMDSLWSKQGLLVVVSWIFLGLAVIVAMGTMWPVISNIWTENPMGLGPDFYNRVCLPLFTAMALVMCVCPWFNWRQGILDMQGLLAVVLVFAVSVAGLWIGGMRDFMPLVAASAGTAGMVSMIFYILSRREVRRSRKGWGLYLVHFGVAMIVLGVAFSGPYQEEIQVRLSQGESAEISGFEVTYSDFREEHDPGVSIYEARLDVTRDGKEVGTMLPQRTLHRNFDQPYSEVSTIFSLGKEIYSTIMGFDQELNVTFKISVNPLVNWIWIGSIILCLSIFMIMGRVRVRAPEN
ncbi:cytochrome c-type biogenesis CcmF C-terminal domain-containing protein [Desulfonatronospira sp.]|uniref:heme lyase CcmF/NrfE family subunit n=1 Tax=Desulfonatronospira sp. TaxID=1962951 RepID=UPI0025C7339D|nr:cytochrome c-type biogenesis CcmF C-terminal domain-containing protein [Desulfonatronospira sp.]